MKVVNPVGTTSNPVMIIDAYRIIAIGNIKEANILSIALY